LTEFPILGSAYKAQKSNNLRDLEANKEFVPRTKALIYQVFFALLGIESNHATKKTKPRLSDIITDQDLWLPGLE